MTHLQYTMRGCHRRRNYILLFIQGRGRQASVVTLFLPTFFNHPPPSLLRVPAEYLHRSAVGRAPREPRWKTLNALRCGFQPCFHKVSPTHTIFGEKKRTFIHISASSRNPGAYFQAAGWTSWGASAVLSFKSNKCNLIHSRHNKTCDGYIRFHAQRFQCFHSFKIEHGLIVRSSDGIWKYLFT